MKKNLSFGAKTACIIQLSLGISLFLWLLFDPAAGEHFRSKRDYILWQNITGDSGLDADDNLKEINRDLFQNLDPETKSALIAGYTRLIEKMNEPALKKGQTAIQSLTREPLYKILWVLAAICLPYMCLKGYRKSYPMTVLLPLITLMYIFELSTYKDSQGSLYPREEELYSYLETPLNPDILSQKQQLQEAFDNYLIKNYLKEEPDNVDKQLFKAKFAFNTALFLEKAKSDFTEPFQRDSSFLLASYFLWNCFFAFYLSRAER